MRLNTAINESGYTLSRDLINKLSYGLLLVCIKMRFILSEHDSTSASFDLSVAVHESNASLILMF